MTIVFVDVNKTILMSDLAANKNSATICNEILAQYVPELFHSWDGKNHVSYYQYLTEKFEKFYNGDYRMVRKKRQEQLPNFLKELKQAAPELVALHDVNDTNLKIKLQHFARNYEGLTESFVNFLKCFLNFFQSSGKGCLVLRSFGHDLQKVGKAIEKLHSGIAIEKANFSDDGFFILNGQKHERLDFLQALNVNKATILLVQDSFAYWRRHHYSSIGGKPFPILEDKFTLFFDDNIEGKYHDITARDVVYAYSEKDKQGIPLKLLLDKNAVSVDPYQVIVDDVYFQRIYNERVVLCGYPQLRV